MLPLAIAQCASQENMRRLLEVLCIALHVQKVGLRTSANRMIAKLALRGSTQSIGVLQNVSIVT